MRLKSLEIKGFKSFADKTVVHFDQNITGIVGPNGCGKSNIIDSIRWVIGEQKISQLRSENLESLVFNGSRSRSASGLAEVSLTFENTKNLLPTEFNTVTITRKFYKSGESEYRLNDVNCRLKDIQNLFMDTGVSTDSYSIIELGMVDDLIKDKDNSRRRMLEQAAGISIYKTRKKEARQKLDLTEQDLARIEDLLFEINNQLKSLENQAKKAEKYYEIKKDYKELSIELAIASLEGFNLTYRELNEQTQAETDRKIHLEAQIAQEEAAIEQEKVGFIEKERALQSMQHEFNDLLQLLRSRENDKNLAAQRLNFLQEKEGSLREFLEKSEGQAKGLEESIAFTTQQVNEEEGKLEHFENQLDEYKESVTQNRQVFDEQRTALDAVRSENLQIQRSQFEAEKKVAVADTSIQNLQRTIQQLEEEREVRGSQLKQLEEDRTGKDEELSTRQRDLQQLQEHHDRTKEQILASQQEMEVLRQELAEESRKLDARKNEYDLLKSLIDSMEGYPESIKFLHKNPAWNHHAPILSDIIYVKENYRAALENVLEPYLNYYVVNNLQEGLQAVHLLDANKKGKANFFLLDKFDGARHAGSQPEGTVPALSVIEVDEPYRFLAEHLLGNVYIAEDEQALENSNGAVVLEKSGKYVKGKHFLTGGSVGLFEGKKIGRAKNLEKLKEAIDLQETVVNNLRAAIQQKHNEVISFNEQLKEQAIRQGQQDINQLSNQLFALQNKIENLHAQQSTGRNRLEDLQQQLQTTQGGIAGTRQELQQLMELIAETGSKLLEQEQAYKTAEQEYNTANARYNEFNLSLTRQQSRINSLKQELTFKSNQLRELANQVENSQAQLKQTVESITESADLLTTAENGLVELLRKKEEDEKILNAADQAYYNIRNQLNEKESELRHKSKEREQLEQLLGAIKDRLNELKLQLAGMKERLQVEFRINLDDILDQSRKTDTPVEELQEKSDRMKKRLENLGEVNPTAIEAFTEMKKRYEFILEQKNDLVTAKDSLLQTIAEVESTANQKFLDTFNQVKENFIKVFKALFTEEDQCDLILENPENLAETGIDIIAKPKGKRPSSITQLSGGEKTLTATALLFAIYLIKPAPFCILDEVDAPLDDANVGKFTNMIRRFSEESQFIIVTHNKMTMGAVDAIYGVTMQEAGVSKLVPVDFRNLN
ncbi:chromosome segregation protein SMC [Flavihumibacter petaseus]|uniref:Chromosome partition protein Smc n=1 Tax=Flavihumibacter petaseus NBRC 106054 TaxID=1220578 RepID=A0A0E9N3I9_9BACT|nr:chromosome segregation protein SMC [Flavihumibacter petaseus]GAO43915.1 chromosome segregation protein SMC [Flavihumibacter petaseus NBRC 106054]